MKPTITVENASGARDSFTVPRRWIGAVADALCDQVSAGLVVEAEINGKRYALEHRTNCNPLW